MELVQVGFNFLEANLFSSPFKTKCTCLCCILHRKCDRRSCRDKKSSCRLVTVMGWWKTVVMDRKKGTSLISYSTLCFHNYLQESTIYLHVENSQKCSSHWEDNPSLDKEWKLSRKALKIFSSWFTTWQNLSSYNTVSFLLWVIVDLITYLNCESQCGAVPVSDIALQLVGFWGKKKEFGNEMNFGYRPSKKCASP